MAAETNIQRSWVNQTRSYWEPILQRLLRSFRPSQSFEPQRFRNPKIACHLGGRQLYIDEPTRLGNSTGRATCNRYWIDCRQNQAGKEETLACLYYSNCLPEKNIHPRWTQMQKCWSTGCFTRVHRQWSTSSRACYQQWSRCHALFHRNHWVRDKCC